MGDLIGDYVRPALRNREILLDLLEQLKVPGKQPTAVITRGSTHFLFGSLLYDESKCILCASCAMTCPAKAIEVDDSGDTRRMIHLHYRCVHCTQCVQACPEQALSMVEGLNLDDMFTRIGRERMKGDLDHCSECGRHLGPVLQLDRLRSQVDEAGEGEYRELPLTLCRLCRRRHAAEKSLAPGPDLD